MQLEEAGEVEQVEEERSGYKADGTPDWNDYNEKIAQDWCKNRCKSCYGRGYIKYDLGHNNPYGVPPTVEFQGYCPCVIKRYDKLQKIKDS